MSVRYLPYSKNFDTPCGPAYGRRNGSKQPRQKRAAAGCGKNLVPRQKTKRRRRTSRKQKEFISSILFLAVSLLSVTGLLIYLWVYNEIILTEKGNVGLRKTKEALLEDNNRLEGNIARLMRADRITSLAEKELSLVTPVPETLVVFIEPRDFSDRGGEK